MVFEFWVAHKAAFSATSKNVIILVFFILAFLLFFSICLEQPIASNNFYQTHLRSVNSQTTKINRQIKLTGETNQVKQLKHNHGDSMISEEFYVLCSNLLGILTDVL